MCEPLSLPDAQALVAAICRTNDIAEPDWSHPREAARRIWMTLPTESVFPATHRAMREIAFLLERYVAHVDRERGRASVIAELRAHTDKREAESKFHVSHGLRHQIEGEAASIRNLANKLERGEPLDPKETA